MPPRRVSAMLPPRGASGQSAIPLNQKILSFKLSQPGLIESANHDHHCCNMSPKTAHESVPQCENPFHKIQAYKAWSVRHTSRSHKASTLGLPNVFIVLLYPGRAAGSCTFAACSVGNMQRLGSARNCALISQLQKVHCIVLAA